jgi:hypothetical protein
MERSQHIPGAGPRRHQLGLVTEPTPHQPIDQPHLLGDDEYEDALNF